MTRGEHMKQARKRAGFSQRDLSKASGIHQQTINSLENGYVQGNISTIEMLADALGISIDEYVGHKVAEKKHKDPLLDYFGL
jgi:transcriptional regulator with XRE-family HTH domain